MDHGWRYQITKNSCNIQSKSRMTWIINFVSISYCQVKQLELPLIQDLLIITILVFIDIIKTIKCIFKRCSIGDRMYLLQARYFEMYLIVLMAGHGHLRMRVRKHDLYYKTLDLNCIQLNINFPSMGPIILIRNGLLQQHFAVKETTGTLTVKH